MLKWWSYKGGAGVAINPVAFLVINQDNVKLLPVSHSSAIDKLLDYVPDLFEKVSDVMNKCLNDKKEKTSEVLKQMQETEKDINNNILNDQAKKEKLKKVTIEKEIKKPENTSVEYEFEYEENKKEDILETRKEDELEDE